MDRALQFLAIYWPLLALAAVVGLMILTHGWRRWLRTALRVASRPLLLLAVVAIVYDGTLTLAGPGRVTITSFDEHWRTIAPKLHENAQRKTPAVIWNQGVSRIARLPTWAVLGGLGLLLAYVGRRRKEVNIFAN